MDGYKMNNERNFFIYSCYTLMLCVVKIHKSIREWSYGWKDIYAPIPNMARVGANAIWIEDM